MITSATGTLQVKENLRDEKLKNLSSSHNIWGLLRKNDIGENLRMQDKGMNSDFLLKNLRAAGTKQFQWPNKAVGNFISL